MAVKLRLRREGTNKVPHYRIVAADTRAPRNGRFIEILGDYHPLTDPSTITLDHERALHWLRVGAQPSSQVEKLLRIEGVWEEFKPGDEPQRDRAGAKEARAKAAKLATAQESDAAGKVDGGDTPDKAGPAARDAGKDDAEAVDDAPDTPDDDETGDDA